LLLDGAHGGLGGDGHFEAGNGGARDVGGDAKGTRDLGEGHFGEVLVAERLEEALGGREELLSGIPFLLAEAVEAFGPVGGEFELALLVAGRLLLQETRVEGEETVGPIELAGPVFHGRKALGEAIGDGLKRAAMAELKPGHESAVGSRGFAGKAMEELRVES